MTETARSAREYAQRVLDDAVSMGWLVGPSSEVLHHYDVVCSSPFRAIRCYLLTPRWSHMMPVIGVGPNMVVVHRPGWTGQAVEVWSL